MARIIKSKIREVYKAFPVSRFPDDVTQEINQEINEEMSRVRQDSSKKQAVSEQDTSKVILNS